MTEPIGEEFMRQTRYENMGKPAQGQGLPQPPLELPWDEKAELIPLPSPSDLNLPSFDLQMAIEQRKTLRAYSDQELSRTDLSYLLWCTQGVKSATDRPSLLRPVPSAGARHPFETYLLINKVEGLEPGLYRFISTRHSLIAVDLQPDIAEKIAHACLDQKQILKSAVTFLWEAVVERTSWRYGQRAFRYMHLDAGHVCQNLYLAAESIGCGVCAIAAFDDQLLNEAVGLDGKREFIIYAATLGKKPSNLT
jgi:SagB-type dehydrogenase family enzyme